MNLFERPLTQKVNFGDDPINNKVYGLDFSISKDAPWLTKLIDKLPLIKTKEASTISAQAEVAVLQPGHNRAINQGGDKGGTVYLDDFEGSTANIPLTTQFNQWVIASVPQDNPDWLPMDQLFRNPILPIPNFPWGPIVPGFPGISLTPVRATNRMAPTHTPA